MTMDPVIVRNACRAWKGAELLRLPRSVVEPVMWIEGTQLRMYHPALTSELMRINPMAWDRPLFEQVTGELARPAAEIIEGELFAMRLPTTYFAEYPGIVAAYSFEAEEPPQPQVVEGIIE